MIKSPIIFNLKEYKKCGLTTSPDLSNYSSWALRNDGCMYLAGLGTSYVIKYVHSKSIFFINTKKSPYKGEDLSLIIQSKRTQGSYQRCHCIGFT
jgi:hypothetical protein